MMECTKCGAENSEESSFCSKCGERLSASNREGIESMESTEKILRENSLDKFKKITSNKNNRVILFSVVALIIMAIGASIYLNNPIAKFKDNISNNNNVEAMKIYNQKLKGDTSKEAEVIMFLKDDMTSINKAFIDEKIDFNEAKTALEAIQNTGLIAADINAVLKKVTDLNNSRMSFNKATAFLANIDYINAIKEYKNVIAEDKNYSKAQEQIKINEAKYKEQVLQTVDNYATANEYNKAVSILNEATLILPNDGDLIAKKVYFEKVQIQKLIDEQEVAVVGVREYTNIINTNFIAVTVHNRSQKTVKKYYLGFMGFDKNGLPVKVGLGGGEFVGRGNNDQNILPGETKSSDGGWYLDNHDVVTLIACIDKVEYYDGNNWDNPYYDYWIKQYQEKPFQ